MLKRIEDECQPSSMAPPALSCHTGGGHVLSPSLKPVNELGLYALRAEARVAYEAADKVMTARAEKRGAESSEGMEHFWWADVSAPMLFGSSDAHRNEMEEISLPDLHACCAHRLSVLSRARGGEGKSYAPLYICITENQDLIKGFKIGLASFSQCRDFIAHDGGRMQVSSPDHADIRLMQVQYAVTRCMGPSPFEESKAATVAVREMFFRSGGW